MSKRKISEIEAGAGFFQGFISNLMDLVRERGVPFVAVYRLALPSGRATLGKIVDLAHQDWLDEQPKPAVREGDHPYRGGQSSGGSALPPDHYRVYLAYAGMPPIADLKKEFGEDNVSPIFDGRPWELHPSCADMPRTPGDRTFYVHDVGREWESEERIAWGLAQRTEAAPNGYRPATHEEAYEFQKAYPELLDLVALGSSAAYGGRRGVAVVWRGDGRRVLALARFDGRWSAGYRVLLVSK